MFIKKLPLFNVFVRKVWYVLTVNSFQYEHSNGL